MARTRRSTIGSFAGAGGVFNKIFAELARRGGKPERIMIDATHLKAHRTAASLLKKGLFPDVSGARKAA
jgi:putative transposase